MTYQEKFALLKSRIDGASARAESIISKCTWIAAALTATLLLLKVFGIINWLLVLVFLPVLSVGLLVGFWTLFQLLKGKP